MAGRPLRGPHALETPSFFVVAIPTLGLGIEANTAILSVVNSLLLRPLQVPDPDRLVTISSPTALRFGFTARAEWNFQMWERLRESERTHSTGPSPSRPSGSTSRRRERRHPWTACT